MMPGMGSDGIIDFEPNLGLVIVVAFINYCRVAISEPVPDLMRIVYNDGGRPILIILIFSGF